MFMAWINLRGLKESVRLFSIPVYLYIATLALLIGTGLVEILVNGVTPTAVATGQLAWVDRVDVFRGCLPPCPI